MSGHSKWSTIKHQKAVNDAKKGKTFSKLVRGISLAVKSGGGPDPDSNAKLRMAVDQAKAANMPKANIDRAISKAGTEAAGLVEISYEGFGPYGIGVIMEVATDNKNRTGADLKNILEKGGENVITTSKKTRFVLGLVTLCTLLTTLSCNNRPSPVDGTTTTPQESELAKVIKDAPARWKATQPDYSNTENYASFYKSYQRVGVLGEKALSDAGDYRDGLNIRVANNCVYVQRRGPEEKYANIAWYNTNYEQPKLLFSKVSFSRVHMEPNNQVTPTVEFVFHEGLDETMVDPMSRTNFRSKSVRGFRS